MGTKAVSDERIKVAVPFYGGLLRPGRGMEKIFFIGEVERRSGTYGKVYLRIWNSTADGDLVGWLCSQGVRGLVCSDRHPGLEADLSRKGIRVCWELEGEVEEMIAFWHRAQAA